MKQIKFVAAVLAAMVFQSGNCMESWYGSALSLAFKGKAAEAVQIVHNNDKGAIKVTDPELVPEEIHDIVEEIPQFIAIDREQNSNKVVYSIDGLSWNKTTLPAVAEDYSFWRSICYGNGKFVAVGYEDGEKASKARVAYSTDGKTWLSASNLPDEFRYMSICYGNNKFVAVDWDGKATYSFDGINWNQEIKQIGDDYDAWESVCYGNGIFVAVRDNSVTYSKNGIDWEDPTSVTGSWESILYAKDKFVISSTYWLKNLKCSDDGITWTDTSLSQNVSSVCYGKNMFVAASNGKGILYSPDVNTEWTKIEDKPVLSYMWKSVCYGKGKFVAVGGSTSESNKFTWSADGIHWATPQDLPIALSEPLIYCKSK